MKGQKGIDGVKGQKGIDGGKGQKGIDGVGDKGDHGDKGDFGEKGIWGLDGANSHVYKYSNQWGSPGAPIPHVDGYVGVSNMATQAFGTGGSRTIIPTTKDISGIDMTDWFNNLLTHINNGGSAFGTIMKRSASNIFESGNITEVINPTPAPGDQPHFQITWTILAGGGTLEPASVGDDVMVSWVLNGTKGDTGTTGNKGQKGVEGPDGPDGPKGDKGIIGIPGFSAAVYNFAKKTLGEPGLTVWANPPITAAGVRLDASEFLNLEGFVTIIGSVPAHFPVYPAITAGLPIIPAGGSNNNFYGRVLPADGYVTYLAANFIEIGANETVK